MNENHSICLIVLLAVHNTVFYFPDHSFHDNLVFDFFFPDNYLNYIFFKISY